MASASQTAAYNAARTGSWWSQIIPVVVGLGGFSLYATFRAFEGALFQWGPYLSPFYSPLIDVQHLLGGKLDCFSCAKAGGMRHSSWRGASLLNEHHMLFAWSSLFSVGFADFYVRLVASGAIRDLRIL